MGRTNKARLAAVWMVYYTSKHCCWGECNSDCMLFPVCLSDFVTSHPRSDIPIPLIAYGCHTFHKCLINMYDTSVRGVIITPLCLIGPLGCVWGGGGRGVITILELAIKEYYYL